MKRRLFYFAMPLIALFVLGSCSNDLAEIESVDNKKNAMPELMSFKVSEDEAKEVVNADYKSNGQTEANSATAVSHLKNWF